MPDWLLRHLADKSGLTGGLARAPLARAGARAEAWITAAVNTARWHVWAQVVARHEALPGVRLAD
jgi:hypothetical protein